MSSSGAAAASLQAANASASSRWVRMLKGSSRIADLKRSVFGRKAQLESDKQAAEEASLEVLQEFNSGKNVSKKSHFRRRKGYEKKRDYYDLKACQDWRTEKELGAQSWRADTDRFKETEPGQVLLAGTDQLPKPVELSSEELLTDKEKALVDDIMDGNPEKTLAPYRKYISKSVAADIAGILDRIRALKSAEAGTGDEDDNPADTLSGLEAKLRKIVSGIVLKHVTGKNDIAADPDDDPDEEPDGGSSTTGKSGLPPIAELPVEDLLSDVEQTLVDDLMEEDNQKVLLPLMPYLSDEDLQEISSLRAQIFAEKNP
ncbi:MAG: hypothetical protein IJ857_02265, partial [Lachnospiraceae bacterium]|nr:hypothetical protein [Lachnospiraceae bacterium]